MGIRSKRHGILLVTTLIMIAFVLMILVAAVQLNKGGASMASATKDQEMATMAAISGIHYAQTRLQQRSDWNGTLDATESNPVIDLPNMQVTEDNGVVTGWMRTPTGDVAQFRLRFNYYDGAGGADGLDNPANPIPLQYVSCNNLGNDSPADVYRAPGGGQADTSTAVYQIPGFHACVIVEGRAGFGLRDLPDSGTDLGNVRVASRVVEVYMGMPVSAYGDAVAYAGSEIVSRTNSNVKVRTVDDLDVPRIRSMGKVEADNAYSGIFDLGGSNGDGEAYYLTGPNPISDITNGTTKKYQNAQEAAGDFLSIAWDDLRKADPVADPSVPTVPAGTYEWQDDGSLIYYAEDYTGPGWTPTTAGVTLPSNDLSGGAGAVVASTDPDGSGGGVDQDIRILKDVYVQPSGGATGFSVIPGGTLLDQGKRPATVFVDDPDPDVPPPVMTAPGQIWIRGKLKGVGSITAEGNINFQGQSQLDVDPNTGVAVYSKGSIKLEAIPEVVVQVARGKGKGIDILTGGITGNPSDQMINGVLFAMQDFETDLIEDDLGILLTEPGKLEIRGVVVAYGGDPGSTNPQVDGPGTNGGSMILKANEISLTFDRQYVENLRMLGTMALEQKMWANY